VRRDARLHPPSRRSRRLPRSLRTSAGALCTRPTQLLSQCAYRTSAGLSGAPPGLEPGTCGLKEPARPISRSRATCGMDGDQPSRGRSGAFCGRMGPSAARLRVELDGPSAAGVAPGWSGVINPPNCLRTRRPGSHSTGLNPLGTPLSTRPCTGPRSCVPTACFQPLHFPRAWFSTLCGIPTPTVRTDHENMVTPGG